MLYGSEYWAVNKKMEQKMSEVEMKILRCMSGITREVKIRNEYKRTSVGVA